MAALYLILIFVLGVVVISSVASLLLLLAAASARQSARVPTAAPLRLAVLIPAHNEELVLAATLDSLRAQAYPADCFESIVIADNCTDDTVAVARSRGVTVLERVNLADRGKGYALDWALSRLLDRPAPADAFVIVDADTWVAPDFLALIAARLVAHKDGRGFCAVQGRYGVLNADEGWRASLMAGAFDLYNHVKPLGRDRLGLGVGLKGNGMAFTRALLETARWRGESVTEDIDYGLDLARFHNVRVIYAPEARVLAQMPTTAAQAASQRERWERGRFSLLRARALPLMGEGLRRRRLALCDAAFDLMLPPLAELMALTQVWGGLILLGWYTHLLSHPLWWAAAYFGAVVGLVVYVLGGLRVAGASRQTYVALLRAPFYALWKFRLLGRRKRHASGPASAEWVRTDRAPIPSAAANLPPSAPPEAHAE